MTTILKHRRAVLVLGGIFLLAGAAGMTVHAQINIKNIIVQESVNPSAPCSGIFPCWLTKKGAVVVDPSVLTDPAVIEARKYYQKIQAFRDAPTLKAFKIKNQFVLNNLSPRNVGFQAFYFNNGDLQLGREMHCNQQAAHMACYVSNYGPQPFPSGTLDNNTIYPNSAQAISEIEAVAQNGPASASPHPFATVAMESLPPAPPTKLVTVREADGVTTNPNPPKNCLADYSGNIPPSNADVDTGLDIETGDTVVFSATGALWAGYCFNGRNSPDGMAWTAEGNSDYPLDIAHEDALIGTVGQPGSQYFEIGSNLRYEHKGKPGRLFLRTNDNNPGNGSGAFFVNIKIHRQQVRFYVYIPSEKNPEPMCKNFPGEECLSLAAALDREGNKSVPQMCMACHGGRYTVDADPRDPDSFSHEANNSSFLPFDVFSFLYSQKPGLRLDDQQEAFRQLNLLVKSTNPNPGNMNQPIHNLIDAFYDNHVDVAQTKAVAPKPPASWQGHDDLYQGFYARYCRTCHSAQDVPYDFSDFEAFSRSAVGGDVCGGIMPHAQVPYTALAGAKLDFVAAKDLITLSFPCLAESLPRLIGPVRR